MLPDLPDGFVYRPEFLTPEEERELVERLSGLELRQFEFNGYHGKRRTVSFGLHYDFADARLRDAPAMPAFLTSLRERTATFAGVPADSLLHALVTEYMPGAGIGWHRDRPVFDDVIGISLLAECRVRFRRSAKEGRWERASLMLQPRSAYLLRGAARTQWEHSIPAMAELRYSITFRTTRH